MSRPPLLSSMKMRVYDFIIDYKSHNDGNSPTVREITKALGISSVSVTRYCLISLAGMGMIEFGGRLPRMIRVIGGFWNAPTARAN